jgi:L-lactate dehydrogenase complex protein LldE
MACRIIDTFGGYEYVVAPSGSCAATVRHHYPGLFAAGSSERAAAEVLAARTWELTSFLHDVAGVRECDTGLAVTATYQDACAGLRELAVQAQPRALLRSVRGLSLVELSHSEQCCGFGGLFAMKYPEVSARIADQKCAAIAGTGARCVIGGDLGCLMHLEGRLHRLGQRINALHVAEVLAGMTGIRADEQR